MSLLSTTGMRRAAAYALRALSSSSAALNVQQPVITAAATSASPSSVSQMLQRCGFATNSTDIFNTHKDSPHNNASTPFVISEASAMH